MDRLPVPAHGVDPIQGAILILASAAPDGGRAFTIALLALIGFWVVVLGVIGIRGRRGTLSPFDRVFLVAGYPLLVLFIAGIHLLRELP